ncbi:MAG: GAF domain-containing protein [Oscillochloris sp.]|nr:GAF domain-containing protein [Oscillochloris sp.]
MLYAFSSLLRTPHRSAALRYSAAVTAIAVALLVSMLLRPLVVQNPFIFFFAAIAFSAAYGGFVPGLLATALAVLCTNFFFLPPIYSFTIALSDLLRLAVFAAVALIISSLSDTLSRTQQIAQAQSEHFRVTLLSIGDAVIVTDTGGRITFMNAVAEKLTGWRIDEARGRPIELVFRLINSRTRRPIPSAATQILQDATGSLTEHSILLDKHGRELPIDDSGAPIRDAAGQLIGVVLIFRDASERETAEAARAELLAREQATRVEAEHAREQMAFLAEAGAILSRSLDYAVTLQQVASLAVPRICDWCAVDLIVGPDRLQRMATVHSDPAKIALAEELFQRYPPLPDAPGGSWQAIQQKQVQLHSELDDELLSQIAQDDEHLALLRQAQIRAIIFAPLLGDDQVLGVLTLVMAESGRRYRNEDAELALALGRRAALAIEKAQIYAAEQQARVAAEQLADRIGRLQTVTAALAAAPQPEDVARAVTEQCIQALGACASAIVTYDPRRRTLKLLHASGYGQAFIDWAEFSVDGPYPFSDVVRSGEPVYVPSREAFHHRYPELAAAPMITEAATYLALIVDGKPIGGMSIGFPDQRNLDPDERTFLEALASQCAQALERARLFAAEQQARERLAFLAEASTQLSESLDYNQIMAQTARICVPRLADWCVIETPGDNGMLVTETIAHTDPAKEQWARELRARYPVRSDAPIGAAAVIRSGQAQLYPDISDQMIAQATDDPEERRLLQSIGYRSIVVVPLRSHARIIGTLALISSHESNRRYTEDDVVFAEELARRAALAIENATLYGSAQEARKAAEESAGRIARLQHVTAALSTTVLPEQVAELMVREGLEAAGADAGAVYLISADGLMWEAVSFHGYPPELVPRHVRVPIDRAGPLTDARKSKRLVLVETPGELLERWPQLAQAQAQAGDAAIAAVPLLLDQTVIGVLSVAFRQPRRFSTDDRTFLAALGRQCAQALDRARLYAAEHNARTAAEEAILLRDRFLSIASHELKTPLTSLLLQTQLLQRRVDQAGLLPEREQQTLQTVANQGRRLERMVSTLLDISRIERNQLAISVEPVDLCALVKRIAGEIQPTSEVHRITCLTGETELLVAGDELRLEQVVQNLIQNAIKYSPAGGPIELVVERHESQVCVTVYDRGIGLPEDALPQLFERFYRAPNADPSQISGLGIGLYIVREIVRLHGGSVSAARRTDGQGGSSFRVCLPQA